MIHRGAGLAQLYGRFNIIRIKLTIWEKHVICEDVAGLGEGRGSSPRQAMPMDKAQRKAAISAYKERDAAVGIFAVRCLASGEVWVGPSLNLDTIKNRIWFGLRMGSALNAEMQRAWSIHGSDSF